LNKKGRYFWGIIFIAIGIAFLGNNLSWWKVNLFFDGWWSLFIIVPSIYGLFNKESFSCSIISLAVGVLLLLAAQDIIDWGMIWKILVPVIIIVIGLTLIFGTFKKGKKITDKNAKEYIAIFSGVDEKLKEVISDFRCTSIFGGVDLDLRKAKIKNDIVIDAVTIFGGIDLKLPLGVKVKINGIPLFGGVENKYENDSDAKVTIYINYTCIFGGIDIL